MSDPSRKSDKLGQLKSIGMLMMACSAICFLIAYERYASAQATGKAIADLLPGVDFVSTPTPAISFISLGLGVTLLVAGASCWWQWYRQDRIPPGGPIQ